MDVKPAIVVRAKLVGGVMEVRLAVGIRAILVGGVAAVAKSGGAMIAAGGVRMGVEQTWQLWHLQLLVQRKINMLQSFGENIKVMINTII